MIISRISSGLGNQFFQYATARAISIRSNATLKLDLDFFETDKQRKYRLNQYNIIENLASKEDINLYKKETSEKNNFARRILNRIASKGIEYVSKTHIREKPGVSFASEILKLQDNFYLEGYWQNQNYFKGIRESLLEEFRLKYFVEKTTLELIETVRTCNSVSIHIRRGDYLSIDFFSVLPLDYYNGAIEHIKERVVNPIFFVFSDDIIWAKKKLNQSEKFHFIDQNGGETEFFDLEIMKNCNHNIIANSSFSWWGAWLNRNPDKVVIAPKKWYNNSIAQKNIETGKLVPSDWIKL